MIGSHEALGRDAQDVSIHQRKNLGALLLALRNDGLLIFEVQAVVCQASRTTLVFCSLPTRLPIPATNLAYLLSRLPIQALCVSNVVH